MARAKRTNRTDARRRYRAENLAAGVDTTAEEIEDAPAAAPPRRRGTAPASVRAAQAPASAGPGGQRPGILSSLRAAYRPVHLREDIAGLPLLLTQPGVVGTMAAAIAASAFFVITYSPAISSIPVGDALGLTNVVVANQLPYLLLNLMVMPPPAAGAFLVGYFAKRSPWLGGLIFGLVAALCFTVLVATPAGRLLTGDNDKSVYVLQAWLLGPVGAVVFAAASGWYRRFLRMATPPRQPRPGSGPSKTAKVVQGRGDVPRNRLSGGR